MCTSPSSASEERRRLEFPLHSGGACVADGIDFTRRTLADWQLIGHPTAEEAVLVAAELLANAAEHADGPLALVLQRRPGRLRIAVTDRSPEPPRIDAFHRPSDAKGRGLAVVERTAAVWGSAPDGCGKRVWAELMLPGEPGAPDPGAAEEAAHAAAAAAAATAAPR
ncbi:ATP-binding protein [Kitasatospora sp. NPDC093679]|uniref:ATP-binding protein n=1 Tax=Kitasatospora sp. NPDC093679 TaxID=3154983 RepID=UPI0034327B5E